MQVRDKLFLSGLVLATGVSGAMWFRKSPEERAAAAPDPEKRIVLREAFHPNPPPEDKPKQSASPLTPVPLKDPETPVANLPKQTLDGSPAPPSMPSRFSTAWGSESAPAKGESAATFGSIAGSVPPGSPARFGPIPTPSGPLVPLPRNPFAASAVNVEKPVTHTVVDGDTLSHLAERYLGNAGRKMELFDANRDLLRDPDVLPLGLELRIPSAR